MRLSAAGPVPAEAAAAAVAGDGALADMGGGAAGVPAAAALGTDPGPSPTAAGSPLRPSAVKPVARGVGSTSRLVPAGLTLQQWQQQHASRTP